MKEICLKIPGKPIAKNRPRFFRAKDYVGTYSDQETEEGRWMWEAKNQITPELQRSLPLTGPIRLRLCFMMPTTKGWPKYKIEWINNGLLIPHVKTPDLDNLIKWVKDCLNGWLWKDDSQVYQIEAYKIYSLEATTSIEIIEVGE